MWAARGLLCCCWLGLVAPLSLQLVLNDAAVTVHFRQDDDALKVAVGFCSDNAITHPECAPALVSQIMAEQAAHMATTAKVVGATGAGGASASGWGTCSTRVFDAFPRLVQVGEAGVLFVTGEGFNCLAGVNGTIGYEAKAFGGTASVGRFAMPARVARVNDSHLELRFDAGGRQTAGMSTVRLDLAPSMRHQPTLHTTFPVMFADFAAVDMPPQLHLGCGRDLIPGWFNMDALMKRSTFFDWGIQADLADGAAADKLRRSLVRWAWADGLQVFTAGSVRSITMSHALMYCPAHDRAATIAEFARLLRPGGVVRVVEDSDYNGEQATFVDPVLLASQFRAAGLCPVEVNQSSTHHSDPDGGIRRSGVHRGFALEGVKVPCERLASAAPLRHSTGTAGAHAADNFGINPGASFWEERKRFSADSPGIVRLWLDGTVATVNFLPGDDALGVAAGFCSDNDVRFAECAAVVAQEIEDARAGSRAGTGGTASRSVAHTPAMLQARVQAPRSGNPDEGVVCVEGECASSS
jgi:hypothetical protein